MVLWIVSHNGALCNSRVHCGHANADGRGLWKQEGDVLKSEEHLKMWSVWYLYFNREYVLKNTEKLATWVTFWITRTS